MLHRFDLVNTCQRLIELLLLAVFVSVPLLVIPITTELFEFNKMYLVHGIAWLILMLELMKLGLTKKPVVNIPPLYKTGLIFLAVLILVTIFSIDQHVSWFGYYDRWNGGLWSWFSYAVIFYAIAQLSRDKLMWLIKASLLSSVAVSTWGFLEHFGIDASYWVQDVKSRVFSTLGQPNWLAAYLAMLFPWIIYYYLKVNTKLERLCFYILAVLNFIVFIFTYSRGGNLGLAAAVVIFFILIGDKLIRTHWKRLMMLTLSCVAILILFATPLTQTLFGSTPHREIGTLETGDETGNIRLIVWDGALQIFYHHPILGTGLETFGESFYQYRPAAMNYNSEWDFLFNKAHNEYLNYLATTGIIGLLTYFLLLASYYGQSLRTIINHHPESSLLAASLASTTGYLVQNIFSFTVVPLAILLILNLSTVSLLKASILTWTWPTRLRQLVIQHLALLLTIPAILGMILIFNIWRADPTYGTGAGYLDAGETDQAIQTLTDAVRLNSTEPLYLMQLADAYSTRAVANGKIQNEDSDIRAAVKLADQATSISPGDISLWRKKGIIYERLNQLNPDFGDKTIAIRLKERQLDPTDPSVLIELGHIYLLMNNLNGAKEAYLQAVNLKRDYLDPYVALTNLYLQQGNINAAKDSLKKAQQIDPSNENVVTLSQKAELQ